MNEAEVDKCSNVMLPGFRFHPTDEELVGFYLKRKIQQRTLPIELIKQLDIYQYDPWDLPKASWAPTGEKEWYFYCLRDRKYRNSARPNRVTKAGFWKATGTDRPVHSSDGRCIGLKKSLVFYRGRAARGTKTDWMMHEFRLPLLPPPHKNPNLPALDPWTICKIFRKAGARAQRVWVSPFSGPMEEEPGMPSPSRFASRASPQNTMSLPQEMPECSQMLLNQTLHGCPLIQVEENDAGQMKNPGWEGIQSIGIPFILSPSLWRPGLPWEPSLAGPTDILPTGYRI